MYLAVTSYTQNLLNNGKCKGQLSLILYLTFKSKYDFNSTSKTWLSTYFSIPIYETTILYTPIHWLQREFTFLITLIVQLLYTSTEREQLVYIIQCAVRFWSAANSRAKNKTLLVAHLTILIICGDVFITVCHTGSLKRIRHRPTHPHFFQPVIISPPTSDPNCVSASSSIYRIVWPLNSLRNGWAT